LQMGSLVILRESWFALTVRHEHLVNTQERDTVDSCPKSQDWFLCKRIFPQSIE
jgi:hypothetical protein